MPVAVKFCWCQAIYNCQAMSSNNTISCALEVESRDIVNLKKIYKFILNKILDLHFNFQVLGCILLPCSVVIDRPCH